MSTVLETYNYHSWANQKLFERLKELPNDVFRWSASQTASAMEMTVAAVNSALQRARATLNRANLASGSLKAVDANVDQQLLNRFVAVFERYDIDALMALFHEDGSLSMPPFVMWVRGRVNVGAFYEVTRFHCLGSRLLPTRVNGTPAFAQYTPGQEGQLEPWGIHVPEIRDNHIIHVHTFIDSALYSRLGLPMSLDATHKLHLDQNPSLDR